MRMENVYLPQSLSLPTCTHPSSKEWRAMQSVQKRGWQVKLCWRWWAEASHVVSLNRNTVSQCSESQEIKICAFPGEWLWICHALYWRLLVYSFPFFFYSVTRIACAYEGWPHLLCWNNVWCKYMFSSKLMLKNPKNKDRLLLLWPY